MRRTCLILLLAVLLVLCLTACATPASEAPAPEEVPEMSESSQSTYTISLAGRDDLVFGCAVWTDSAGESGTELDLTEERRAVLERLFDGRVVSGGELPANINTISLRTDTCTIGIDDFGFVSVVDGDFTGGFDLTPEEFEALCALLPENAMVNKG